MAGALAWVGIVVGLVVVLVLLLYWFAVSHEKKVNRQQ